MKQLNLSIRWKLMIICFFLVFTPVIILGVLNYFAAENEIYKQVEDNLGNQSLNWQKIARMYDEQINSILKREDELIRSEVAAVSLDVKKMIELIVEQYGIEPPEDVLELLYDKIASIVVGQTGYVYIIDNKGNYVVSKDRLRDGENIWNSQDANGRYFIQEMVINGSKLAGDDIYPIDYPWKNLGETVSRMKLAGISYFEPWDVIIGASSYYSDFKSTDIRNDLIEELKNRIASEIIGESGYIWVVNSEGDYIVSKDRERDGENIWNSQDANGVFFIQEMVNMAKKLEPGKFYIHYYPWKNNNETSQRMKIAAVTYVDSLDWIIGPSSYHEDFLKGLDSIRIITLFTGLIAIILGIIVSYIFSSKIAKLLTVTSKMANEISKGNLDLEKLNINRSDEIGILSMSFSKMLDELKNKENIIKLIGEGDLTIDISRVSDRDNLSDSLINMRDSLNIILGNVSRAIDQISMGADQISQSSQSLSQGATEQASSLEEISSSLVQINSQANRNSENSLEANNLAKTNVNNAETGNHKMEELLAFMENINESSDAIKKIVELIDDIAFQINLLALNANVEAARAGKYGKGFAVVADEVRSLAIKSANAVKETTTMVEDSINNIRQGYKAAEITSKQFKSIVDSSSKIAQCLEEISSSSKEQALGINQINSGLNQISQVTQANTANAEQSAAASEELASQAVTLKTMISRFKLRQKETIEKYKNLGISKEDLKELLAREIEKLKENGELNYFAKENNEKRNLNASPFVNPKDEIKLDDDNFDGF